MGTRTEYILPRRNTRTVARVVRQTHTTLGRRSQEMTGTLARKGVAGELILTEDVRHSSGGPLVKPHFVPDARPDQD